MFPGWERRQDAPLDEPYPDGSPMGCRGAALGPGCCRAAALDPHYGAEDVSLLQSPHCRAHPPATAPSASQQGDGSMQCGAAAGAAVPVPCCCHRAVQGLCAQPDTAWNAGHRLHSGHCMEHRTVHARMPSCTRTPPGWALPAARGGF